MHELFRLQDHSWFSHKKIGQVLWEGEEKGGK